MRLRLVTPAASPVTLSDAKTHCRVVGNDDDAALTQMIAAAAETVQSEAGFAFGPQTWEAVLDAFPSGCINLDFGPLISVTSITYTDPDGDEQTVDPAGYTFQEAARIGVINPVGSWPATISGPNAVVVRFVAGEGWPLNIRHAVLMLVEYWYGQRGAASEGRIEEAPFATTYLVGKHRRMFV
jgi:uncharacterized phiE125 gp8 family phage protein